MSNDTPVWLSVRLYKLCVSVTIPILSLVSVISSSPLVVRRTGCSGQKGNLRLVTCDTSHPHRGQKSLPEARRVGRKRLPFLQSRKSPCLLDVYGVGTA